MNEIVLLLAQATEADPGGGGELAGGLLGPLLNVGIVGIILVCIVARKFFIPEWVLRDAEQRHERELASRDADIAELKTMVDKATTQYNEQVIPAFTRSIDVNREYVELLREAASPPRAPRRPASRQ